MTSSTADSAWRPRSARCRTPRGRRRAGAPRAAPRGRTVPGARARGPPVPMAADLSLRHVASRRRSATFRSSGRRSASWQPPARTRGPARAARGAARRGCARRGPAAVAAARELERYFAGRLRVFRTPVDLRFAGTPFTRGILRGHPDDPLRRAVDLRRRRRGRGPGRRGEGRGLHAGPLPHRAVHPVPPSGSGGTRPRLLRRRGGSPGVAPSAGARDLRTRRPSMREHGSMRRP